MLGLPNVDNRCFVNSCVQVLASCSWTTSKLYAAIEVAGRRTCATLLARAIAAVRGDDAVARLDTDADRAQLVKVQFERGANCTLLAACNIVWASMLAGAHDQL